MAKLLQVNSDTKLVSECLDLIEFLYQHGKDPKLVVKHWNATQQIQSLRRDVYPEHTKLAKVLEDEIALYPQLQDIFLFFWKDATPGGMAPREFLIGGTSPYTLVFTSPNWQRCITKNGFNFKRLNGNPMFGTGSFEPLMNRDAGFKDMLYSLRMAYHGTLTNQASEFLAYITTTWTAEGSPVSTANTPGSFMAAFNCIKDKDGAAVFSALSFSAGAVLPLIVAWLSPLKLAFLLIILSTLFSLAVLGYISSVLSKASPVRAIIRITFWSTMAMLLSMGIGHFAGQALL